MLDVPEEKHTRTRSRTSENISVYDVGGKEGEGEDGKEVECVLCGDKVVLPMLYKCPKCLRNVCRVKCSKRMGVIWFFSARIADKEGHAKENSQCIIFQYTS